MNSKNFIRYVRNRNDHWCTVEPGNPNPRVHVPVGNKAKPLSWDFPVPTGHQWWILCLLTMSKILRIVFLMTVWPFKPQFYYYTILLLYYFRGQSFGWVANFLNFLNACQWMSNCSPVQLWQKCLLATYEPLYEKSGFLHVWKQRGRSALWWPRSWSGPLLSLCG